VTSNEVDNVANLLLRFCHLALRSCHHPIKHFSKYWARTDLDIKGVLETNFKGEFLIVMLMIYPPGYGNDTLWIPYRYPLISISFYF
jgi:hypothetical protein